MNNTVRISFFTSLSGKLVSLLITTMMMAVGFSTIGHAQLGEVEMREMFSEGPGQACGNSALQGTYGALGWGFAAPPGQTPLPFAQIGLLSFDGIGGVTNKVTRSNNGIISRGNDVGSYTINPDCTGTITILTPNPPFQLTFDLVIADLQGPKIANEFYYIATTPGGVVVSSARKVSKKGN